MTKCPQGKIINPKTGRCVKKDGRIGKEILKSRRKSRRKSRKTTRKSRRKSRKRKSRKPARKSRKRKSRKPARKSRKRKSRKPARKSHKPITLKNLNENFLSYITKNSFKFILDKEIKIRKRKFTISTDAKKTIIQIVFTLILDIINIAKEKCDNCVISDKDIITALITILALPNGSHDPLLQNAISNINETINASRGLTNLNDIRKIKNLELIDILSQFVENDSKHIVDKSGLITITTLVVYFFSYAIEIGILYAQPHTSRISSFDVIYGMFDDFEFLGLMKHHILSPSVYNKFLVQFNLYKNSPTIERRKKLVSEITCEYMFKTRKNLLTEITEIDESLL